MELKACSKGSTTELYLRIHLLTDCFTVSCHHIRQYCNRNYNSQERNMRIWLYEAKNKNKIRVQVPCNWWH